MGLIDGFVKGFLKRWLRDNWFIILLAVAAMSIWFLILFKIGGMID